MLFQRKHWYRGLQKITDMRKLFRILRNFTITRYGGHLGRIGRALAVWLMSGILQVK